MIKVGVFPFRDLVLFPEAHLPMYIFEPHYVQMIKDSIKEPFPIAIGLGDPVKDKNGKEIPSMLRPKEIMCIGRAEIVEEYDDGSLYIILKGEGKVRLLRPLSHENYLICEGELLPDKLGEGISPVFPSLSHLESHITAFAKNYIGERKSRNSFLSGIKTAGQLIDYLCTFVVQDRDIKQILLETPYLGEKMSILGAILQRPGEHPSRYLGKLIKNFDFATPAQIVH